MKITFVRAPFTLLSLSAGWNMATLLPTSRAEADTVVVNKNLRDVPQLSPQESRRLEGPELDLKDCPPPEDENLSCEQKGENLRKDYQNTIDELNKLFSEEDCQTFIIIGDRPTFADEYQKCVSIQEAICSVATAKDDAVNQTVVACEKSKEALEEADKVQANIDIAIADFNARRALAPVDVGDPENLPECLVTSLIPIPVKETISESMTGIQITLEVIGAVRDNVSTVKDSADATIFGVAVGLGIGVVLGVLTAAMKSLTIANIALNDKLIQSAYEDAKRAGVCKKAKEKYAKALAQDTNEHVEVIEQTTDEIQDYVEFLSCRFGENTAVFVGAGCDGLDNDCDSDVLGGIIRVDECDEDQVPPTLELSKDPPATFFSQEEGEAWFMAHTVVSDDCVPQARLLKTLVEPSVEGQVTIRVDDTRCSEDILGVRQRALVDGRSLQVDGPGQPTTIRTFTFEIDGDAPTVTCGFGAGGDPLFIDRFDVNRDLVDVQFWFNIVELPAPSTPEDVQVSIIVESNEYEASSSREMLRVFKERSRGGANRRAIRFNALLAPYTCGDSEAESPCLSETGGADAARFYDITVVATDSSGNVGEATCTVVAVPEYDPNPNANPSSKKKERPTNEALLGQLASSSKRFMLEEIKFVYNTSEDVGPVSPAATLPPARNGNNGSLKIP